MAIPKFTNTRKDRMQVGVCLVYLANPPAGSKNRQTKGGSASTEDHQAPSPPFPYFLSL